MHDFVEDTKLDVSQDVMVMMLFQRVVEERTHSLMAKLLGEKAQSIRW
jgi:hypothetical protein